MDKAYPFRAITDRSSLEGTGYVELMGGAYAQQCWNDGSLFFKEEVFGYLEPTIEKHAPAYDHYAFTRVDMRDWEKIVADLLGIRDALEAKALRSDTLTRIGFLFINSKQKFTENLNVYCIALGALITQVEIWTGEQQSVHGCVTILGL